MKKKSVVFLHPDLGIGGAERLVVDAGLALQSQGHRVQFVTNHHDPNHCFEETKNGRFRVTVIGDWLPRSSFGGRFRAFWAYLRMIVAAIYISMYGVSWTNDGSHNRKRPDVIFCDQISACIPFLKEVPILSWLLPYSPKRIVFYCHFPDQLLTDRRSYMKKVYRYFIDKCEEITTGMADKILVNSNYTAAKFGDTFTSLNVKPDVLYPSFYSKTFDVTRMPARPMGALRSVDLTFTILSINRYERKKNLPLALKALANLRQRGYQYHDIRLIMTGGHDPLCIENVEHLKELKEMAKNLDLPTKGENAVMLFRTNTTTELLHKWIVESDVLIYTPSGEPFGIVPIDAMYLGTPVIAVNDGAVPNETVLHEVTGLLCNSSEDDFADAVAKLQQQLHLNVDAEEKMANSCREHINNNFSFKVFSEKLDEIVKA